MLTSAAKPTEAQNNAAAAKTPDHKIRLKQLFMQNSCFGSCVEIKENLPEHHANPPVFLVKIPLILSEILHFLNWPQDTLKKIIRCDKYFSAAGRNKFCRAGARLSARRAPVPERPGNRRQGIP